MSRRTPPPRPMRRNPPKVKRAPSRRRRLTTTRTTTRTARATRATRTARSGGSSGTTSRARSSSSRGGAVRRSTTPPRARRQPTVRQPAANHRRKHVASRPVEPKPAEKRVSPRRTPTVKQHRFSVGRSRLRLIALLVVLVLILGVVLFRVGEIQTTGGEGLRTAAVEQWTRRTPLPADRGAIFDRDGEELAMSIPAASISVNPKLVTDETGTAQMLQSVLGLDEAETSELYETLVAKETGFSYVRREVSPEIGEQISRLELTGVNVDDEDRRVLPGGNTGWSVIGRTDIDGIGIGGLELQYDELLTGTPGELTKEVAPQGRSIAGTEQISSLPTPGNDIVLTIDRSIQFSSEQALVDQVSKLGAGAGQAIVMDTDTGEVLAMASVDRNDDNQVVVTSGNFAAVNAYEPGSVAKVITIAAGLNERAVTPDTVFVVPWRKKYADDLLSDSHQHPDEAMTVEQILVESSNIGTISVQQSIGSTWDEAREVHWNYMRQFGLGEKTALDFPGESNGILKDWDELWGSERVTVAYGQGVASTSIQLATAVNAIANNGTYVAPQLVKATVGPDGVMTETEPAATHEVMRPEVAAEMQRMMRRVVCDGTATRAQLGIENFTVAGKTGTGLKPHPNGQYEDANGNRLYYSSFAGFFPAEDPQVTVLVSIDEPPGGDINHFGGTAAAPVFAKLAPTIVHERGIQPPSDSQPCT